MPVTEYKSAPTRLVRLFRNSRNKWKRRCADKQAAIKKMRVTIRDLTDSRDRWKRVASQQAHELAQLRQQVLQLKQPQLLPQPGVSSGKA